ncbi:Protein Y53G8AR.7 a [Aphelenchoides avenae]|nr:Protein Y53G8AR.7 a [Aphelenchus avenae]
MTIRALKTAILTLPSTSKVSDSEKQSFPKTSASPSCSDASISPSFSTPEKRKTDWRSIYISSVLTFMSAIQFSLYFSSQWPYLQKVDPSSTETFFGLVVSVYSLSQMLTSPFVGFWSNKLRQITLPVTACLLFSFVGNAIYFCAQLFPSDGKYVVLVGRLMSGIGSCSIGLFKAYAATASVPKDRTRSIAFVTGGMAMGSTIGPALQILFLPIGYPGVRLFGSLHLHMLNAPALFCCCMNLGSIVFMKCMFNESYAGVVDKNKAGDIDAVKLPNYDKVAVGLCNGIRFTQMFIVTNLETIGLPFAMMMFAWNDSTAVKYSAMAHMVLGGFSFTIYLGYIVFNIGKYTSHRLVCLLGLIGLVAFHLITFSWPFLPNHVATYNSTSTLDEAGCNVASRPWCETLTRVNVFMYYASYCIFVGLAFSNLNISMNTLYSRIIGPRFQGTLQGILMTSGGAARTSGPLIVG